MAYSRWSNSRFYTYLRSSSISNSRDDKVFVICGELDIFYWEMKEDIDGVLERVQEHYIRHHNEQLTTDELLELQGYMGQFMRDIEESF